MGSDWTGGGCGVSTWDCPGRRIHKPTKPPFTVHDSDRELWVENTQPFHLLTKAANGRTVLSMLVLGYVHVLRVLLCVWWYLLSIQGPKLTLKPDPTQKYIWLRDILYLAAVFVVQSGLLSEYPPKYYYSDTAVMMELQVNVFFSWW